MMFKKSLSTCLVVLQLFQLCFTENPHEKMPENWIDPYDMSPSKDYLQYSDSISSLHAQFSDKTNDKISCGLSDLYFKRTINMLLNSVHEDFIDHDLYSGHLYFKIDAEKYAFLKGFAEGTEENDLEKVDKILSDILNKPTHEFLQQHLESWFHKLLNVILSREGIISIVVVSYIYVIFKLFNANLYSMRVVKFLLINFLLFDFLFTWVHLYQKEQGEEMMNKIKYANIPDECNPMNMNSLQILVNAFSKEDECHKYYQIKYTDIFYKITPGTVLTEMFARTIQYPAKSIGRAFGEMCYGIYDSFSWPLNIIILPVALIFMCLMTCMLLSLILSKQVKFNFLHLISFSFGGENNRTQPRDMISGNNLERLLSVTDNHRQFVQEIPVKITEGDLKLKLKQIQEKKTNKYSEERKRRSIKNKLEEKDEKKLTDSTEKVQKNLTDSAEENQKKLTDLASGDHK